MNRKGTGVLALFISLCVLQVAFGRDDMGGWRVAPPEKAALELVKEMSVPGGGEFRLVYQFLTPGFAGQGNESIFMELEKPVTMDFDAEDFGVWMDGDGSGHRLYFLFQDAKGRRLLDISSEGPQLFRAVSFKGRRFLRISPEHDFFAEQDGRSGPGEITPPLALVGFQLDDMAPGIGRGQLTFSLGERKVAPGEALSERSLPRSASPAVTITSDRFGNMSFGDEDIDFRVTVANGAERPLRAVRTMMMTDFAGDLLRRESSELSLSSGGSSTTAFMVPKGHRGFFRLACSLESAGRTVASAETTGGVFVPLEVKFPERSPVGMYHWIGSPSEKELPLIGKMGFRWVRYDLRWDLVEKVKGVHDWSFYDRLASVGSACQLELVPGIYYLPDWASRAPKHQYGGDPADVAVFAAFCGQAAARYKDCIMYWEIWNEPDAPSHWAGTPEAFGDMLRQCHAEIKRANPEALMLAGGFTGLRALWRPFVRRLLASGAGDRFDIYDFHYGAGELDFAEGAAHVAELKAAALRKEIWNTEESSWPTKALEYAVLNQANGIRRTILFLFRITHGVEAQTALVNPDYSPRLPFATCHVFLKALNGLSFQKELPASGGGRAFLFGDVGKRLVVAWRKGRRCSGIKAMAAGLRVTDALGATTEMTPFASRVSLPMESLVYIEGVEDSFEFTPPLLEFADGGLELFPGEERSLRVLVRNPAAVVAEFSVSLSVSSAPAKPFAERDVVVGPGGEVSIDFPLCAAAPLVSNFKVRAELRQSGRLAGYDCLDAQIVAPLKLELFPAFRGDVKNIVLKVGNCGGAPVAGTITVLLPVGWKSDWSQSCALAPGEVKEYSVPIPEPAARSMTDKVPVSASIVSDSGKMEVKTAASLTWIRCRQSTGALNLTATLPTGDMEPETALSLILRAPTSPPRTS